MGALAPFFLTQKRWQIALAACLGMVIAQGMRCNFPAAKIVMMESSRFNWSEQQIANIESAYFYGYGVSQIPAGLLATEFSPSKLFGASVLLAGVCNALTALCFSFELDIGVVVVQVLQGIVVGLSQPAIHGVIRAWGPPSERSELTSTAFNGMYVGVACGVALSAWLSSFHWASSFYLYAVLSLLWTFLWFFVSASCPKKHRSITEAELHYILSSIGEHSADHVKLSEVPWRGMLTSLPVWATVVVNTALNWNIYMFVNQQLYYLTSVFGMSSEQAGLVVAPSQLVQAAMVTLTAAFSDHLLSSNRFSKKLVRKGFVALGFVGQSLCLLALGTIAFNSYIAVALMILASGTIGFTLASFMVNQFDIAPFFAPILLGYANTISAVAGLNNFVVEPLAAQGESGWSLCFFIGAGVNVVALLFFQFFGSVDLQTWAKHGEEEIRNSRKNTAVEEAPDAKKGSV
uniref:MFS domain-containing protein n=1 Tax=Steinernema glaseri TaxID=37863 RepID=A0A1I8AJ46_9BILA